MKPFEDAQEGDKVWCKINGWGKVAQVNLTLDLIGVHFTNVSTTYNLEGEHISHEGRSLYYLKRS